MKSEGGSTRVLSCTGPPRSTKASSTAHAIVMRLACRLEFAYLNERELALYLLSTYYYLLLLTHYSLLITYALRCATSRDATPSMHALIHSFEQINASPTAFRSNGGQRAAFAHTQHKRVALVPNPRHDKADSLSSR